MAGADPVHPYMPADLHLPDYVPNLLHWTTILGIYGAASAVFTALVWLISGRSKVVKIERLLICWWAFTGLTQIILEGYFLLSPEFYKDKSEYSKGDSRYAGRDTCIVALEGIAVLLVGPSCLLAVYAIATRKSYDYILQFALSLGLLYGTSVYYIVPILDGDNISTSTLHYYGYFIVMNSFWIIIPVLVCIRCRRKICASMEAQSQKKTKSS